MQGALGHMLLISPASINRDDMRASLVVDPGPVTAI